MTVNTKYISSQLRYLPKSELEKYCREAGMTERELGAVIDYLYNHVKIDVLCSRLGISKSTFIRHEKVLAVRLLRYMVSIGAIDRIEEEKNGVSALSVDFQ